MTCKLIALLLVVTAVQLSKANPIQNHENYTRVAWNEPHVFCGEFLGKLVNEICKGALVGAMNEKIKFEPQYCEMKCNLGDFKQHYCTDKSPDSRTHVDVPKGKPAAAAFSDTSGSRPTVATIPRSHRPNTDVVKLFSQNDCESTRTRPSDGAER